MLPIWHLLIISSMLAAAASSHAHPLMINCGCWSTSTWHSNGEHLNIERPMDHKCSPMQAPVHPSICHRRWDRFWRRSLHLALAEEQQQQQQMRLPLQIAAPQLSKAQASAVQLLPSLWSLTGRALTVAGARL